LLTTLLHRASGSSGPLLDILWRNGRIGTVTPTCVPQAGRGEGALTQYAWRGAQALSGREKSLGYCRT
jgi:hypothetical protein